MTVQEPHLAWIAKLSVLETLPTGWEERAGDDGVMMYRNIETGRTTTEHPSDASFRALVHRYAPCPCVCPCSPRTLSHWAASGISLCVGGAGLSYEQWKLLLERE